MTKKNRIAVVLSLIYCFGILVFGMTIEKIGASLVLMPVVLLYWGYRFVKGDISFLKMKNLD